MLEELSAYLMHGADTDLLEQILTILMSSETCFPEETDNLAEHSMRTKQLVEWLMQLSKFDKFESMMQFASSDIVDKSVKFLEQQVSICDEEFSGELETSRIDLDHVKNKFKQFQSA